MNHPRACGWSPWGDIQHVKTIVPGHIYVISTAGHGGAKLSREYNALVDPSWRVKGGWYEEDVEIAIVLITFQNSFPKGSVDIGNVRDTLARHYPREYSAWWPFEKSIADQTGRPYDAAEVKAAAAKASAEIKAMFPPKPREKRPARIFTSEGPGGFSQIQIVPGDTVVCDFCNKDYTDSPESGGFLFSGYAVCPKCAPKELEKIKGHGEEDGIQGVCPDGMSFADWIRSIR